MSVVEFLQQHVLLVTLFCGAVVWFLINEFAVRLPSGVAWVRADEVVDAINHKDAQIWDVRSSDHYGQGHVMGAISMPLATLDPKQLLARVRTLKSGKSGKSEKSAKPIILVCSNGREARAFARYFDRDMRRVQPIAVLEGGMAAWVDAMLPVVRDEAANEGAVKVSS